MRICRERYKFFTLNPCRNQINHYPGRNLVWKASPHPTISTSNPSIKSLWRIAQGSLKISLNSIVNLPPNRKSITNMKSFKLRSRKIADTPMKKLKKGKNNSRSADHSNLQSQLNLKNKVSKFTIIPTQRLPKRDRLWIWEKGWNKCKWIGKLKNNSRRKKYSCWNRVIGTKYRTMIGIVKNSWINYVSRWWMSP